MTNIFDKIICFVKKNFLFITIYVFLITICFFPLPYYIECTGGSINVFDKIDSDIEFDTTGSLNMSYVSEINATIPTYIYAMFNKNWDIYKKSEFIANNETADEMKFRNKLLLEEANQNAIYYAYMISGKSIKIEDAKTYVTYIDTDSVTNLKIGDEIISIDGINVSSKQEIVKIVSTYNVGEIVNFKVIRNNEEIDAAAKIYLLDDKKVIGLILTENKEFILSPDINIKFDSSESGPSGGMMMTLGVYSIINNIDYTNGKKIVGTGTIDINGNVDSISGVKYKLAGAIKDKADIFFVPAGENYDEAIDLKKENDYNIEIVEIDNFSTLLSYLENNIYNY